MRSAKYLFSSDHMGRFAKKKKSVFCAFVGALIVSGCASSLRMPAFVDDDVTGSIAKPSNPLDPSLDAEDWRRAHGAMALALDPQGNGAPVAWDNQQSGAKGSFSPVGVAYPKDDKICRAFVAELSGALAPAKLQGTACRDGSGEWTVGSLHPQKS